MTNQSNEVEPSAPQQADEQHTDVQDTAGEAQKAADLTDGSTGTTSNENDAA